MAADEHNLFDSEAFFVTLDENTGNYIFWFFDIFRGQFYNSETAEFFVCPVISFDFCHLPVDAICQLIDDVRQ